MDGAIDGIGEDVVRVQAIAEANELKSGGQVFKEGLQYRVGGN